MTPTPSEARQVAQGEWNAADELALLRSQRKELRRMLRRATLEGEQLRQRLAERDEEIRALRQGGEAWQPIATAPKDGRELLLATLNGIRPYVGKFSQYDLEWCEPNGLIRLPTHWQPLPPPPAEGEAA